MQTTYQFEKFKVTLSPHAIIYESNYRMINVFLDVEVDAQCNGGKIQIKHQDRWGSEMVFTHYSPTDLQSLFVFIGKGFNVFKALNIEV